MVDSICRDTVPEKSVESPKEAIARHLVEISQRHRQQIKEREQLYRLNLPQRAPQAYT